MATDDLIRTLSDDDVSDEDFNSESESKVIPQSTNGTKRKRAAKEQTAAVKKIRKDEDPDLDSDFEFENEQNIEEPADLDTWALNGDSRKATKAVDIDAIIARRRPEQGIAVSINGGVGANSEDEVGDDDDDDDDEQDEEESEMRHNYSESESENEVVLDDDEDDIEDNDDGEHSHADIDDVAESEEEAAPVAHPDDLASEMDDDNEEEDAIEREKRDAFFAAGGDADLPAGPNAGFHSMNLSRPILKGLAAIGFSKPTPIQAKTIPVALEGKDLVGGAVTGSGKTAAFLIPILERLLFRPKRTATTRVAILMPTRELALQCFNVAKKLASFTDITFGQAIGGLNAREQEKQLKLRPDVVIATPGRFIDLERNTAALAVNTVEILVLDEADRMLEDGFADELNEILDKIPKSRQTMLFSATMTSKVDDLIRVGLQRPVRLMVDSQKQTVSGLVQEFVRLRPGKEEKRLAYLLYLCTSVFTERAIIFFRQKVEAHRVRVIFGLCGIKAAELHGSMSQEQRINAIEAFRMNTASFLLATDLASRGLDIKGIETVINYEAPQTHEIYLHRVGRTARAGRSGKSCTLAAEPDRKVVKAAVKMGKTQGAQIRQRTVDTKDIDSWHARLQGLEEDIEAVLKEEKEERILQQVDRDLTRADNLVKFEDEIKARPKKTWFESERDKKAARDRGSAMLNGALEGDARPSKGKKEKLSNKKRKRLQDTDERKAGAMWKKGKAERMGGGALKPPPKGKGKGKSNSKAKPRVDKK